MSDMISMRVAKLAGVGALVVAWLAVAAGTRPRQSIVQEPPQPVVSATDTLAADLERQTERLRERLDSAPQPRQFNRNPFEFGANGTMPAEVHASDRGPVASEPVPSAQRPPLALIGVAEYRLPNGVRRTAVITGLGQLFFANEGDMVTSRFRVTAVGAEAIDVSDLTDDSTFRLTLASGRTSAEHARP